MEEEKYQDKFMVNCLGGCQAAHLMFNMRRAVNLSTNFMGLICKDCFENAPDNVIEILSYMQVEEMRTISVN